MKSSMWHRLVGIENENDVRNSLNSRYRLLNEDANFNKLVPIKISIITDPGPSSQPRKFRSSFFLLHLQ